MLEIFFWVGVAVIVYCYVGYGLILFLLNKTRAFLRRPKVVNAPELPPVTLVIAAWNEHDVLKEKINNTFSLDYPANLLHIIIVTDGSDDESESLVKTYPEVQLLHLPERKGKSAALNRAMREVVSPLVFFSDANAMLNPQAINMMVKHFSDPQVGGVAGEKKIIPQSGSAVGQGENLYWQYESFLKKQDAGFHSVIGAAGELFAIRTACWQPLPDEVILDDFVIAMKVGLQGYRFAYEPAAFACERPSHSFAEEKKRKVRIAAGAFQSINYLGELFHPLRFPVLSFQFFSRRILRWFVCPILLPLLLLVNIYLAGESEGLVYPVLLAGQIVFYSCAAIAYIFQQFNWHPQWLTAIFYFVFMNYCLFKGAWNFFQGNHTVLWDKSLREAFE